MPKKLPPATSADQRRDSRQNVKKITDTPTTNALTGFAAGAVDERLQLVNGGERGPIEEVSLSEGLITFLRGLLLDFDPDRLHPDLASAEILADPRKMWKGIVGVWLSRHAVFAKSQVVSSGRGLHAIVWFSKPVEFDNESDRRKWAAAVKILQKLLPTDPDCPGITALTRPVGSINGKNGATVQILREGEPVEPAEVLAFCDAVIAKPFATVVRLLFGDVKIAPCPVCRGAESRLDALDFVGKCYGSCGKVTRGQIMALFQKPRPETKGGQRQTTES